MYSRNDVLCLPYDFVGVLHNNALDSLKQAALYAQRNDVVISGNAVLFSFLIRNGIVFVPDDPLLATDITWVEFSEALPEFDELRKDGSISSYEHSYLAGLDAIMNDLDDDLFRSERTIEEIRNLEGSILGDDQLSQNNIALLMSTSSVARRSIEYWNREANDPDSAWFPPSRDISSVASKKGLKDTVKKDAKGAVKGVASGASLISGPWAIAIAAGLGGVKGSAGGAIKSGAKKLAGKIKDLL